MPPTIENTLLDLFNQVRQDPSTMPMVPIDDWQEGSVEWELLSDFQAMQEQVQQRMHQFKQMEQQLREREEQYRSVFEASTDGLFIQELEDGRVVEVNPAACEMHGFTHEEFIGLLPAYFIHPDSFTLVTETLQTIQGGGQYHARGLAKHKDGTPFHAEAHVTTFTYKGRPHLLSIVRDVTEQVQAEEQLREKEEQYRSVFEATGDGLIIRDMNGYVVEANPAACSMHGYTYEEFIGLHRTDIIDPADHAMVAEYMKAIQAGRSFRGQAVDIRKDGTAFPVEVRGSTFTYLGKPHTLSVLRDITERVEAEKQLREKEEQYRAVFEATYDGLAILNLERRYVEVNPAFCQMFGYAREELIGMHVSALAPVSSQSNIVEAMDAFKDGIGYHVVGNALRKDRTIFICDARSTLFIYRSQRHILVVARDVTERVEAERELQEREEQYRSIFEATSDGLIIRNMDGAVVEVNPAACKMHGYSYDEYLALSRRTLIHPDYHPQLREIIQTIKAGRTFQGQAVDLRKDGSTFPVEVRSDPFTFLGQPHMLTVLHDITERVEAEKLLEQRVEERTRELTTLLEVSHNVASTLELKPLMNIILNQIKDVVEYTAATILIRDGDELVIVDYLGPASREVILNVRYPTRSIGVDDIVLRKGEPVIIDDVLASTPLAQDYREAVGDMLKAFSTYLHSLLVVPLKLKDHVIGMLSLASSEISCYTPHHASLISAIANQAAVAIENARLYEQAQALAAIEERQRLARELHDSVSQALYGISLGIHTARMQLERNPENLAESLDYVLELADAALIEMRALIFELRPESLETEGLVTALTKQAAALQARQGIIVRLELGKEPELPLKVKQDLYRIAQEALHNTVKHAHASQVVLRLEESNNEVIMEIHDDGRGFDASASFPGHLGLHSMRERITNLGGMCQIESAEGKGTNICIRIPRQGAFRR